MANLQEAALLSAELAGFDLQDLALRVEEGQAQILWMRSKVEPSERRPPNGPRVQNLAAAIRAGVKDHLRQTGEPASYHHLQAAALCSLAQSHRLLAAESPETTAAERFKQLTAALEDAFVRPNAFSRYGFDDQMPNRVYAYNNRISGERTIGTVALTLIKVADDRLGDTDALQTGDGLTALYSSRVRTLIDGPAARLPPEARAT